MTNLYVSEAYINATEGYCYGESGISEAFTSDRGQLYRRLRDEYGRCIGKVCRDSPSGPPEAIGWVFQGRTKYEDTGETYLREVWVTLHTEPPTVTTEYHYASA